MEPVRLADTEIDRCRGCGGLWFDMLEHEDLRTVPAAATLDTGDPAVGARYDRVGLVRCPVDNQPMVRMVDRAKPDLWFESCPLCYGVFFDAGEFSAFREDDVRDLFVRHRRRRQF
jgi:Zn-finger nucleic acid-binding protein